MKYLYKIDVNIGCLIAIIFRNFVMIVFDHGQPALLYLVPGCAFSVLGTTTYKGESLDLWNFSEDEYITTPEEEET